MYTAADGYHSTTQTEPTVTARRSCSLSVTQVISLKHNLLPRIHKQDTSQI